MNIIIKNTRTIREFKEKQQNLMNLAELAYQKHKNSCNWENGEPIKAWYSNDNPNSNTIRIQYASGKIWYYKNLELPFSTWWPGE